MKTSDLRIIGVDHVPVGVVEALWSFGSTLAIAAALIWWMLHFWLGDRVLNRGLRALSAAFAVVVWGCIQYGRGSDVAGSVLLGIEAGTLTLLVGIGYERLVHYLRERA